MGRRWWWLTPVGGVGLHAQLVRGVVAVAAEEVELVEHLLRFGVHVAVGAPHRCLRSQSNEQKKTTVKIGYLKPGRKKYR